MPWPDYPQLFSQDEAVLGYDALSIWQTGQDQHSNAFPVHFRTFNDYVPPVANYLAAPFVGLLGLNEFNTRLPFALLGIATVFLVALLGRRWFGGLAGLLAALFLTVDPWHLTYSRTAFPASCVPFFTVAALYTFTRAMANLSLTAQPARLQWRAGYGWLAGSALCFALLTACYSTMKLQGPLLVGACVLAAAPLLWRKRRMAFGWLSFYLLCLSPVIANQLVYWPLLQTRYNYISVLDEPDWLLQIFRNYALHYDPVAMFLTGFKDGVSVRPAGVGELFLAGRVALAGGSGRLRAELARTSGSLATE